MVAEPARIDVVYICDWLPPDFGAVGQYAMHFTQEHAEAGRHVVLVGLSSEQASDNTERFGSGTRRIIRLHAKPYNKTNTAERLKWTLRTNLSLLRAAWGAMKRAEEVVFTGSPPLFLHLIAPANLLARRRLTYRITDFHPECAIAEKVGERTGEDGGGAGLMLSALMTLTKFWRRRVHRFEVLGHDQAKRLGEMGIGPERLVLKRDPSPVTIDATTRPLPRPADAADAHTLLLYSGNWGVAHDEATFLAAYRAHHRTGSGRVRLWLNAVGSRAATVRETLRAEGLPFVDGKPVPLADLASLLVTPDAHLITLRDPFIGYVLPSKVYGCAASGRPVLYVGGAGSDVHLICEEAGLPHYARVEVGAVAELTVALEALADHVDEALADHVDEALADHVDAALADRVDPAPIDAALAAPVEEAPANPTNQTGRANRLDDGTGIAAE